MNTVSYYCNLALLPLYFIVVLVVNLVKSVGFSFREAMEAYRANKVYHQIKQAMKRTGQ